MRKVEVLPYTDKWKEKYQIEAEQLESIFEEELLRIHHIAVIIPKNGDN